MTFSYKGGDILRSDADAIVIPVNTIGVAGAGLAKQWADKYKDALSKYKDVCKDGHLMLGKVMIVRDEPKDKLFILFPTKGHYREHSYLTNIEVGLRAMRWILEKYPIKTVAIPKLGCGLGGLAWVDVHKLIRETLSGIDTHFGIFGYPVGL